MTPSFFSDLEDDSENTSEAIPSSRFFSDIDEDKGSISKKSAASVARGAGSAILSTPRAITGLLKHGSEKLAEKGKEQSGRESDFTKFIVKSLGYPEKLLKKFGVPTYEEISDWHRRKTEGLSDDEELPELSGLEKGLETGSAFLGGSLLSPASVGKSSLLAAGGAGAAAGLGGGAGSQIGAAIGVPAIVNMISLIKRGKLSPTGKEARELYEFGKSKGMTDAELTPILQSKGRKDLLGGSAQPTRRAERAIEASEGAMGGLYSTLKDESSKLPRATPKQESRLLVRLDDVTTDLRKSKLPPDAKKSVIEKIDKMKSDVFENGLGADEIIATWQDINDTVDWRSFKTGKKVLGQLKEPLSDTFKELSPKHFREFEILNNMWGKLQDTSRRVKPTDLTKFVKFGEAGIFGHALINLATTGNPKALAIIAGQRGARVLASEMLTNPRLNNLMNKTIASMSKGTKESVQKSIREFEKGLREYPEIYEDFDFSSLE